MFDFNHYMMTLEVMHIAQDITNNSPKTEVKVVSKHKTRFVCI